jgi:hypothetical protein
MDRWIDHIARYLDDDRPFRKECVRVIDRRRFPRATINVILSANREVKAHIKNLSEGGICIITQVELGRGKTIRLVFIPPDGNELRIKGKVIWSLRLENGVFENGIDFLSMGPHYKEHLARYLN